MDKNKKGLKREFIPLILASTILIVLVGALIYTIASKPASNETKKLENTLITDEISVGNANYVCEGKDINKIKDEASKIYVTYEDLDNYYLGKESNPDVFDAELEDVYGDALRVKFFGITENLYLKIVDENEIDHTNFELYKEDVTKDGFAKYEKVYLSEQSTVNVKVYVDDDKCKNILLREFNITLPRMNTLYKNELCEEKANKDKDVCKKYVFNDNSYEEDVKELTKDSKNKSEDNKDSKEDKKVSPIIYVIVVIMVIGLVGVVFMKGRKKHE